MSSPSPAQAAPSTLNRKAMCLYTDTSFSWDDPIMPHTTQTFSGKAIPLLDTLKGYPKEKETARGRGENTVYSACTVYSVYSACITLVMKKEREVKKTVYTKSVSVSEDDLAYLRSELSKEKKKRAGKRSVAGVLAEIIRYYRDNNKTL